MAQNIRRSVFHSQECPIGDAVKLLQDQGIGISLGQNISKECELRLTQFHNGPVWVTPKPRALETFPYSICPQDEGVAMTADLIAPDGFGESVSSIAVEERQRAGFVMGSSALRQDEIRGQSKNATTRRLGTCECAAPPGTSTRPS